MSTPATTVIVSPDIAALKTRLKATWMAGDFHRIAQSYEPGALEFVRRLNLTPGVRVLDVACGTGGLAIPAARTGAAIVGVDIATNLLEQARGRAAAEHLDARFDEGDCEQLPYDDASFDVVMSMFGVMFAPRPELAAPELTRVLRDGGRLALATWTPEGFIGQMFKTIGRHVPPPAGVPSPLLWGNEATVRDRVSEAEDWQFTKRPMGFRFSMAVPDVIEFWRKFYGPTNRAFEALAATPDKQADLRRDLEQLWSSNNQMTDGSTYVESEYLESIGTRRSRV